MIPQSKGKMFLSAERGHTETDWFRSFNTFQFGNYQHPNKQPFHSLYVLNNDTLAGGKSFSLLVEETSDIIIIPTVGAVRYSDTANNETMIEAGQAQRFTTVKDTTITFENLNEEDPINFIQVWLKKDGSKANFSLQVLDFNLNSHKNQLVELFTSLTDQPNRFFIGKFAGREETNYIIAQQSKGLFLYVIEGAFEVAYRLLETGDALALWDMEETEIEALSNDAIILVIDLLLNS
jgi:quercetin 2,3-dioxygenase